MATPLDAAGASPPFPESSSPSTTTRTPDPTVRWGGDRQGIGSRNSPPLSRGEVAGRHHCRPARHPSHDRATGVGADGGLREGASATPIHGGSVCPLHRRAAPEVPAAVFEPTVRD